MICVGTIRKPHNNRLHSDKIKILKKNYYKAMEILMKENSTDGSITYHQKR